MILPRPGDICQVPGHGVKHATVEQTSGRTLTLNLKLRFRDRSHDASLMMLGLHPCRPTSSLEARYRRRTWRTERRSRIQTATGP